MALLDACCVTVEYIFIVPIIPTHTGFCMLEQISLPHDPMGSYWYCDAFAFFKNVQNMSSMIANKIKINWCLVSIKFFIVRTIFVCPCLQLDEYNNNWLCSLTKQIFTREIFKPLLFSSHATSHKADWILTSGRLLYIHIYIIGHYNLSVRITA